MINYNKLIENKITTHFKGISNANNNILNNKFEEYELTKTLSHTINEKAMGPDRLHNIFIKKLPKHGKQIVLKLFNQCLNKGIFPIDWNKIDIRPIPKPNRDLSNPKHYRPIALASTLGRIFQKKS